MLPLMIQSPSLDLSLALFRCVTNQSSSIGMLSHSQREWETSTHTHETKTIQWLKSSSHMLVWVWASFVLLATHTANRSFIDALWYLIWAWPLWYLHHCVSMCASVSVSMSEYKPHSCNQTASRNRDTQSINQSINQSISIYSFDQSIVGTWSINQSSPLGDTHTNRMLLEATHDTWFKSLTRHHHQQQLSLVHSMMIMMILLFAALPISL